MKENITTDNIQTGDTMYLWPDGSWRQEKAPDNTDNNGIYTCSSGAWPE